MTVEMIKYPAEEDWLFCKQCTLNTVGKTTTSLPSKEWKEKLIKSEHSPIRTLWFGFKLEIPYWVSVHLVRHKFGVEHFVSTQRDDRHPEEEVSRSESPQGKMVSHIIYLNAQAFINIAHKRLCNQASAETRDVVKEMVRLALETNPEFKEVLVPNCIYRGGVCTEMFSCKNS